MVWFCSCSSCWLSSSSNAKSPAKSWLWTMLTCLSWFVFWKKTLEQTGHTLLLATVLLFIFKSVYIFKCWFRNKAICWTVENIVKGWNLVFIIRLTSMIFQSFMFVSIRFGTESLFTILFTTSKIHLDKQSLQLSNNYCSKQIKYHKKRLVFYKNIIINGNKFEHLQCKGFPMHSRQDI